MTALADAIGHSSEKMLESIAFLYRLFNELNESAPQACTIWVEGGFQAPTSHNCAFPSQLDIIRGWSSESSYLRESCRLSVFMSTTARLLFLFFLKNALRVCKNTRTWFNRPLRRFTPHFAPDLHWAQKLSPLVLLSITNTSCNQRS